MAGQLTIAIEGCCHGELDKIYASIKEAEASQGVKVDLLIICGDFQAMRDASDLNSMAVPPKHRHLGTFHKYYTGQVVAPVLTIFIGGNHEASNYHQELPYGGWAAPNIYYMGYASVLTFGGLRIAGLSGIFKNYNYNKGHYERVPLNDNDMRSVYHVRQIEVFKLLQLSDPIDICMSHDWPRGVYRHGDLDQLLRIKPFFREEIDQDSLGSPPAEKLLNVLQPSFWFSAHLHVKFAAVVRHVSGKVTRFLALDKCLPRREFLQIMQIPAKSDTRVLMFDPEWLAILRSTKRFDSTDRYSVNLPSRENGNGERYDYRPTAEELAQVGAFFGNDYTVPLHFFPVKLPPNSLNPQTQWLIEKLQLNSPLSTTTTTSSSSSSSSSATTSSAPYFVPPSLIPHHFVAPSSPPRAHNGGSVTSAAAAPPVPSGPPPSNPDEIDI